MKKLFATRPQGVAGPVGDNLFPLKLSVPGGRSLFFVMGSQSLS